MRAPVPQFRFRAVSMEFAAQLDERRVDMLIVTADGTTIAVECPNDTIFEIERHITKIGRDCPEIAGWKGGADAKTAGTTIEEGGDDPITEGRPSSPRPAHARHRGAEHHRSAAEHLHFAALHHRQASAHYEQEDFARAAHQAQIAYGHLQHALTHSANAGKYHAEHYGDEAVRYGTQHYQQAAPPSSPKS